MLASPFLLFVMTHLAHGVIELRAPEAVAPKGHAQWIDRFDVKPNTKLESMGWKGGHLEEGKSDFFLVKEGSDTFIRSTYLPDSEAKYLYKEVEDWDVAKRPWIRWRWRVRKLPEKASLTDSSASDAPAQIYVLWRYFPRYFVLKYFWSTKDPVGTTFSQGNVILGKLFGRVLQMGLPLNEWRTETRNLQEDFDAAFHQKPPGNVRAIAVLSDADETKGKAEADYDDFEILK